MLNAKGIEQISFALRNSEGWSFAWGMLKMSFVLLQLGIDDLGYLTDQ